MSVTNPPNQPADSRLRDSGLHMALLSWKAGDISMIELKKFINRYSQETAREAVQANQIELAKWITGHLKEGDLEEALTERLEELTQQPAEGEQ